MRKLFLAFFFFAAALSAQVVEETPRFFHAVAAWQPALCKPGSFFYADDSGDLSGCQADKKYHLFARGSGGGTATQNLPWILSPTSGSGTAYIGTPTLLDGSAVSPASLAAPAPGQVLLLLVDVTNSGNFPSLTIDGSTPNLIVAEASDLNSGNGPVPLFFKSSLWFMSPSTAFSAVDGTILITQTGLLAVDFKVNHPVLKGVTGSVSGALTIGTCNTGTATVTGADTTMTVSASPVVFPGAGVTWDAYVSSANTVTVLECGLTTVTPTATTYQVRAIP